MSTTSPATGETGPAPPINWRRNLVAVVAAVFVGLLGANFVFPFMPLYVQQLGVSDPERAAAWTGNIVLVSGLAGTAIAPFWGQLADRRGRKPMLLRALFGAGTALALMAAATGVWTLLVYRLLFQLLAGTVPASNSLVAAHTPPANLGMAMGAVQSGIYLSNSIGPVIGGVLAGAVGLRAAFIVTGGLYAGAGLFALRMVRECFTRPRARGSIVRAVGDDVAVALRIPSLRSAILVLILAVGGAESLFPIIPVYMQRIAHPASDATAAGIAFGAGGVASAVAALLVGRLLKRTGYRRLMLGAAAGQAVLYAVLLTLPPFWTFVLVLGVSGLLQGLMLPAINATIALRSPRGREGGTFGIVSSAQSLAFSVFPFIGGHVLEAAGFRAVFAFSTVSFVVMLAAVWRLMHDARSSPSVS